MTTHPDDPAGAGPSAPEPGPDEQADDGRPSLPRRGLDRLRRAGRWLRAHARHALVVGVLTAVAGAFATVAADRLPDLFEDPPAPPPACPGSGCEGRTPKDSACLADAATWEPAAGNPVRLHLRYSRKCGAAWGRIVDGEPGDMVTVSVRGGTAHSASIDYGRDKFTTMATVGERFAVHFCAVPSSDPHRHGMWEKYCFDATERSGWR